MTNFNLLPSGVRPKFPLGTLALTAEAFRRLPFEDVSAALSRHSQCDWGDVCAEDKDANESAIRDGLRLFSVYHASDGMKFWIITEADRAATTILFPDDY